MNALLCAALLLAAQAPAQRGPRAPTPPVKHDTIYVAVQSPPPSVNVEAPSQWPAVVLGVLGLILVGFQIRIMGRQTDILDRQTAIAAQQAEWRVGEAVGTFVRLAHDLVGEFRKANVPPMMTIEANFDTHPRQMLREASRLFAPLGGAFLVAANLAAMRLDDYFVAVKAYNDSRTSRADRGRYEAVQTLRGQVGGDLDVANTAIPQGSRWTYSDGRDYDFRSLCSLPKAFLESDGWTA